MTNPDIVQPFANSVNDALAQREANAMAFFLPTDGEERIECINPIQVSKPNMKKIDKLIEDLTTNFDIGQALIKVRKTLLTKLKLKNNGK